MRQDQTASWVVMLAVGFMVYLFAVAPRSGKDLILEIAGFAMLLPFAVAFGMVLWAGLTEVARAVIGAMPIWWGHNLRKRED